MIMGMSLLVAILAVIAGPLVSWLVARQQIAVAEREAWMREFRQQTAELLKNCGLRPDEPRQGFEFWLARRLSGGVLRMLIAERAPQYDDFLLHLDALIADDGDHAVRDHFAAAAADILRRERVAGARSLVRAANRHANWPGQRRDS
jgi:hypothetical protein